MAFGVGGLAPALIQTFVCIFVGYSLARFGLLTPAVTQGMSVFASRVALPCLLFQATMVIDLSTVQWSFVAGVALAKVLGFLMGVVATLLMDRSSPLQVAGIRGIFVTQSNDLALGLPIITGLYATSHPEYIHYLFLTQPLSLCMVNPIGFMLIEYGLAKETAKDAPAKSSNWAVARKVLLGVVMNPVVYMVFLGLLWSIFFRSFQPALLQMVLTVYSSAFTALALSILGASMVGKLSALSWRTIMVPAMLIIAKTIIMPILCKIGVTMFGGDESLSLFAFIYGTFPTAPVVFMWALQYGLNGDLFGSAMVLCTMMSAPLMYISSVMANLILTPGTMESIATDLRDVSVDVGAASMVCGVLLIVLLLVARRGSKRSASELVMIPCAFMQVLFPLMNITCGVQTTTAGAYAKFVLLYYGILAGRWFCAIMAISRVLIVTQPAIVAERRIKYWLLPLGFLVPAVATGLVLATGSLQVGLCWVSYGQSENAVSAAMLAISMVTCIVCLAAVQYRLAQVEKEQRTAVHMGNTLTTSLLADQDSSGLQTVVSSGELESGEADRDDVSDDEQDDTVAAGPAGVNLGSRNLRMSAASVPELPVFTPQMQAQIAAAANANAQRNATEGSEISDFHYMAFLGYEIASMGIGAGLTCWSALSAQELSGLQEEIVFLDTSLQFSQGVFMFLIFGLGTNLSAPVVKMALQCKETMTLCLARCTGVQKLPGLKLRGSKNTSVSDERLRRMCTSVFPQLGLLRSSLARAHMFQGQRVRNTFTGAALVDQLHSTAIATTRLEAVVLARQLVDDGLVYEFRRKHAFHDSTDYLYKFVSEFPLTYTPGEPYDAPDETMEFGLSVEDDFAARTRSRSRSQSQSQRPEGMLTT